MAGAKKKPATIKKGDTEGLKKALRLPASSEDIVGTMPLVTNQDGSEYIPEIRKRSASDTRKALYGKDK